MILFYFLCITFGLINQIFGNEEIVVQLANGHVKGLKMMSVNGNAFYSFRGIPYAEPPVGKLRFKPPVSKSSWGDEILDATEDGPSCPQLDILTRTYSGQEDNCLILNVYTNQVLSNINKKQPVIVYIHGGGFLIGSGSSKLYNPRPLMDSGVVVVTLNYRLGLLGFLSTSDAASPGNYGLLDQLEALKWVQKNIGQFGGDKDNVVLVGNSAGGASVVYHTISPLSKDLFHKAIALSGSPLCIWGYQSDPLIWGQKSGIELSCPIHDPQKLVDCLQKIPVKNLTETAHSFNIGFLPIVFSPTVDHHFLTESPSDLLREGKINKDIVFMTSITKSEGSFCYALLPPNLKSEMTIDELKILVKDMLGTSIFNDKAAKLVIKKYFKGVDLRNNEEVQKILIKVYSEGLLENCHIQTAHLMAVAGIKTYAMSYDYEPAYSVIQSFGIKEPLGAAHMDDLFMIFEGVFFNTITDDSETKAMKEKYQKLLTNFVKFGDPTPSLSENIPLDWTEVKPNELWIYHINKQLTIDKQEFQLLDKTKSFNFWTKTVPDTLIESKTRVKDEL